MSTMELTAKSFEQAKAIASALAKTSERAAQAYLDGYSRRRLVERAAMHEAAEG